MTSSPRTRLQALSEQLAAPRPNPGMFEDIPRIPTIAPFQSNEPRARGKVVVITGCNSPTGIGRATAHQFAASSARAIYLTDLDDTHLATHARELRSLYPDVAIHTSKLDASSEPALTALLNSVMCTYSRLDIFFANAGVALPSPPIGSASGDDFMRVMRINALSVFLAVKHASKAMMATSAEKKFPLGSIVATASVAGLRSNAGPTDYSASKAAVVSVVQTAAYQLAGTGIRVNAVCPGVVETGMTKIMYDMARKKGTEGKIGQLNPLRRGAVADEVARVVLFLGSDEASYVNGQAWAVDGGLSAGHPFVPGKMA